MLAERASCNSRGLQADTAKCCGSGNCGQCSKDQCLRITTSCSWAASTSRCVPLPPPPPPPAIFAGSVVSVSYFKAVSTLAYPSVPDFFGGIVSASDSDLAGLFAASTNKIIYRQCKYCDPHLQNLFYKRLTPTSTPISTFLHVLLSYQLDPALGDSFVLTTDTWNQSGNIQGIDYNIYGSYGDALDGTNPWPGCTLPQFPDVRVADGVHTVKYHYLCGPDGSPFIWGQFRSGLGPLIDNVPLFIFSIDGVAFDLQSYWRAKMDPKYTLNLSTPPFPLANPSLATARAAGKCSKDPTCAAVIASYSNCSVSASGCSACGAASNCVGINGYGPGGLYDQGYRGHEFLANVTDVNQYSTPGVFLGSIPNGFVDSFSYQACSWITQEEVYDPTSYSYTQVNDVCAFKTFNFHYEAGDFNVIPASGAIAAEGPVVDGFVRSLI